MKPGTRVTVQGRAGVVKALRPGNSVDVQFDGESFTTRQDGSHVKPLRENPGPRGGLTPAERESLPNSVFALPGRRFPINDANHGRIALQYILAGRVAESDVNTVVQAVLQRWGRNREVMAFYNKHKAKLTRHNVERIHGRRTAANPAGEVYDPAKEQLRARTQGIYETEVRRFLGLPYNTAFKDARGQRLDDSLDAETKRNLSHKAHAIATVVEQRDGNLIPGTRTPTAKGIQRSAERLLDPSQRKHAEENREDYELTLAGARKSSYFRVVTEVIDGQKRHFVQPRPPAGLVQIPAYRLSADKAQEDADRAEAAFRKSPQSVKGRANPYYLRDLHGFTRAIDIDDEPALATVGEGIEVGRETYQSLADRMGVPADILMRYGTVTLQAEDDYVTDETGKRSVLPGLLTGPLVRPHLARSTDPRPSPSDSIPKHMRGGVVSKQALIAAFEAPLRSPKGEWRSLDTERFETRRARNKDPKYAKMRRPAKAVAAESAAEPKAKEVPPALKVPTVVLAPRTWEGYPQRPTRDIDPYVPRETPIPTEEQVEEGRKAQSDIAAAAAAAKQEDLREARERTATLPVPRSHVNVDVDIVHAVHAKLQGREGYGVLVDEGYAVSVYVAPRNATSYDVATFLSGAVRASPIDPDDIRKGIVRSARPDLADIRVAPLEELAKQLEQVSKGSEEDRAAYSPALNKIKAALALRPTAPILPASALGLGPKSIFSAPESAAASLIRQLQYAAPVIDRSRMITGRQYNLWVAEETRNLINAYKAEKNVTQVPNREGRAIDRKARENVDKRLERRKLGRQEVGVLKQALEALLKTDENLLVDKYVLPSLAAPVTAIALSPADKKAIAAKYPNERKKDNREKRERQEDVKKAGAPDLDITRPFWDVETHVDEATGETVIRYVLFVPSTIAYLSKVKQELGRVQLENESAFIRGEKGVTSEDANVPEDESTALLARISAARSSGNFIEMADAQSALARLNQAKQARRSKESLMTQAQAREKSQRIRAAERVALFVLPPPKVESKPSKYGSSSFATTDVITEAEGWMEDVKFTRQRQAEQIRARIKEERVSGPLSGYSKFYTTSPLLAFYTIMLWNSPELFTGFDLGLPSEHEENGKSYWRNISIGPVTSPQNVWHSPLYGYYAALAQLALLRGDLALALLKGNTKRAAEDIIDLDGVSDMTSPVQVGLGDAIEKLGNRLVPLSRRSVGEPEAERKRLEAAIREAEDDLLVGRVKSEDVAFTRGFIAEIKKQLPAEQEAIISYHRTPLAALMRAGAAGVQSLVDDAMRQVNEAIRPLLVTKKRAKKNPQRSFR